MRKHSHPKQKKKMEIKLLSTLFNEPLEHHHHQVPVGRCTRIKKNFNTPNVIVKFSESFPLFPLECDSRWSPLGHTLPLLVIKIQAAPARKIHLPTVSTEGSESKLQATQPSLWILGERFFFHESYRCKRTFVSERYKCF